MPATSLTFFVLLSPFIAAALAPLATRLLGHRAAWLLALVPAGIFLHFTRFSADVAGGGTTAEGYDWIPSLGLRFSWLIDGLSLTFALMISGIGTLIVLYAGGYLKGHAQQGRFFAYILLFMGSMLGVVVSDSLFSLFVYWELTSITSFLLIGFEHERTAARRAAFQALVVTGGGGLSLLAGLLMIWNITGIADLSGLLASGETLRSAPLYPVILVLILGGAFTKSAQFPFHFWLPNAMEAPTPVSAYLHSATMVKAGVYLVMRLFPVMGGTVLWETILPLFGGVTLVFGAVLAVRHVDLKMMLAYTTMASLGLLVMLTGLGSERAIDAAVLYLVAHALFKGALFMVAGIIDHETGTRNLTKLAGLARAMPLTFAIAMVAALSMGGLPPFLGFVAKEEIYAALTAGDSALMLACAAAVLGNALMFAVAFAVALKPFVGPVLPSPQRGEGGSKSRMRGTAGSEQVATPPHPPSGHLLPVGEKGEPHDPPVLLWLGPALMALGGLLTALFAPAFHAAISSPMASAVAGETHVIDLLPVPHWSLPLALSLVTIAIGVGFYLVLARIRAGVAKGLDILGWGPDRGFDQAIAGLVRFSVGVTRRLQPGRLDSYMTVTFVLLALVLLVPPAVYGEFARAPLFPAHIPWHELAIILLAVIGLPAVVLAKNRLTAIVSLGIQGFAVAMIFLLYGAPDLAFTQFMVETLSVVILTLVMTRLRLSPSDRRPLSQVLPDAAIAIACGLGMMLFLMKVTEAPFDSSLSDFFERFSKPLAHGGNIVNVIIVDFRGTDTLGEIAVVMVAALSILSLIRVRAGALRRPDDPAETDGGRR
ncbi:MULTISPECIES: monovalent cation/H+ antiporter subunit A [unclassified Rhizobium]|uniref:monovalent cation/H+ antiporter subunit A n=1 Tax=unclassified Rhizobium TaxID=2613769 RepID=UPI0006F7158D|nr:MULTISPECIES: monovalent cation/H+ antiporter subunit A [unclassified Rhizobium]KQV43544.1 cation:proton antiporter [Rhizobium sp. Root1212]KRD37729.1 cation:proton antiporter [Rhizobium sp. Root268]